MLTRHESAESTGIAVHYNTIVDEWVLLLQWGMVRGGQEDSPHREFGSAGDMAAGQPRRLGVASTRARPSDLTPP